MSDKPNVLIIWGDDIGQSYLSCYSNGLMGYRTPNIDRVAAEGVLFTDYYAEQSCTAGRAAFITGQNPYRTGLTKVGLPGAPLGLQAQDPTIATALKAQGYATGQFGKNHLGDRDEHLPTMHGFDEFFGNLYRLTPKRNPNCRTIRRIPSPQEVRAPRRAAHLGQQRQHPAHRGHRPAHQEADGNLRPRIPRRRSRFHQTTARSRNAVLRVVQHHAHAFRTHTQPDSVGRAGVGNRATTTRCWITTTRSAACWICSTSWASPEHDRHVLHRQRSPHEQLARRRHDPVSQREELQLEGAYRVPALVRWPGHIPAGSVLNGIVSHDDWFVTLFRRRVCPTSLSGCARART